MKTIVSTIILLLVFQSLYSQSTVVATITNLKSNKGVCRTCLFNNSNSFKGEIGQPVQCISTSVNNFTSEAVFNNIPAGTYALFVFHDANSNNRMDKNFLGIPKEGYGASRNRLPFANAPTYEENKFIVDKNSIARLLIKMRNLY